MRELRVSEFYRPFSRQAAFHVNPASRRLFGGAAGPGKSLALLMEAIRRGNEYPKVNTIILRCTFPELEASIIDQFRKKVPREMYLSYNDQKHLVTWHNGSTLRFGYSESEKDIQQYLGTEYYFIGIDESTRFTLKQFLLLTSRNRHPGLRGLMALASNPGGIGHQWHKDLFIDKVPSREMDKEAAAEYEPNDYAFIPAVVSDNPIYANDENYMKTLRALPTAQRQMWLHGDWTVAAGAYFDNWELQRMTVDIDAVGIQRWWPRWISIDWGFAHNLSVHWHAASPPDKAGQRVIYTYREWVTKGVVPSKIGETICNMSRYRIQDEWGSEHELVENIDAIYMDAPRDKRTDEDTIMVQISEALRKNGIEITPEFPDKDREGGWQLMYEMLANGHWKICTCCPEAIRALPTATRDPDYPEDILKTDSVADDVIDELRYGIKSRQKRSRRRPPLEERIAERVTSVDPTIRAMQAQKVLHEETKSVTPVRVVRRARFRAGLQ